jgi:hypothetical protein
MRFYTALLASLFLSIVAFTPVSAQAPRSMSFQGVLTDTSDVPIEGLQTIGVKLFDAASGGTQVWSRTYNSHSVNEGSFNIILEGGSPSFPTLTFNDSLWIQVEAGAEVLSPRTQLTASPYAMGLSLPIEAVATLNTTGSALKITNNTFDSGSRAISGISENGVGVFGVGTTGIQGEGVVGVIGKGQGGVLGISTLASGTGVTGQGGGTGVTGSTVSTSGQGVRGWATALSGTTYGVHGEARSTGGRGVYGEATASDGSTYGVYGQSQSTIGSAVFGWASSSTGHNFGVQGRTSSASGSAVFGWATSTTGLNYGVRGSTFSASGWGGFFDGGKGTYTRGEDNDAPDLVLGGSSSTNDDGRIFSDPSYPSSDIWLHSNDAVVIVLDQDVTGSDADFEVRDNTGTVIFNVDDSGEVRVNNTLVHGSDRNRKEDIRPVEVASILDQVAELPIHRWRYKGESTPHIGPMAQDFYSSFLVGSDEKYIATVDADGVALAAIQGLYELVQTQQAEIERMRAAMARAGIE